MSQKVIDQVLQSPRLPSLPTIALEVIDLVQQKDVNIKQIAHTISHDPALSSRILKIVNSSFYGQAHTVSTITHALVVLGLNSVKTLALGFSLVSNIKDSAADGFDLMKFWKHSLFSAAAAKKIAAQAGIAQQEEVFLGALLQDLGQLALSQTLGPKYHQVIAPAGADRGNALELERQAFDTDHAEIGGALADHWKLPPVLAVPIRHHEEPETAEEDIRPLVRCIALGALIADVFAHEDAGQALHDVLERAEGWFQINKETAESLMAAVHNDTIELAKLFELDTPPLEDPQEILARANEAMMAVSLQNAQETVELQEQNRQLQAKATTDSLTGVANRGHYNEVAAKEFAEAGADKPLSILFLDTDKFKNFNDTYGHQTGDRVLVQKAQALTEAVPDTAFVARYGGEEFSVILPNTDRLTAARIAEKVRLHIASIVVKSDDGEELRITTSVGVACYDGSVFASVDQLIKAADRGVYAAKAAGRNCVRVFAPKLKKSA